MIERLKETGDSWFPYIDEEGIAHLSKLDYLTSDYLDLCGCGYLEAMAKYVRNFLQRMCIKDWGEYEDLPYMFLCYWADKKGYTEHGTTARCSWLTDLGKELLRDLNEVLKDA